MTPGLTAEAAVFDGATGTYGTVQAMEAQRKGALVAPAVCANVGPCRVCITVKGITPRAFVTFSCLGFTRTFSIP
jgi:hypothetical protein